MTKIIKIHPDNPHERAIDQVVEVLEKGGLIIYPNDTVYALGCDSKNPKAIKKLAQLKGIKPDKQMFSIICNDLSHLSEFTKPIDNTTFRMLKRAIPGPFTFILGANKRLPQGFKGRDTIGLRVPDHKVPIEICKKLNSPLTSTSIHLEGEDDSYMTDPEMIKEKFEGKVDLIIDSGIGGNQVSTIVELLDGEPEVLRQGIGDLNAVI